eukprot:354718-Hanusia_phi.AAC.2
MPGVAEVEEKRLVRAGSEVWATERQLGKQLTVYHPYAFPALGDCRDVVDACLVEVGEGKTRPSQPLLTSTCTRGTCPSTPKSPRSPPRRRPWPRRWRTHPGRPSRASTASHDS